MFLQKLRRSAASVIALGALLATSSAARADISIVVNEVDSGGNFVGQLGTFTGGVGQNFLFDASGMTNAGIFDINSINANLTGINTASQSLSTNFNLSINSSYDQLAGHGLQFVVTATNIPNSIGPNAAFTNNASATSGITGTGGLNTIAGVSQVSSTTTIQGVTTGVSTDSRGDGSVVFPAAATTNGNVSNLPNPYSITQTITVLALPVNAGAVITGGTFTAGASSTVTANAAAVPAPGGLALALIALPVLGVRRALRRKSAAAVA